MSTAEHNIKILHAFKRYLPMTQNWAYRIIEAVPDSEVHVYGHYYERTNFYNPHWRFIDFGVGTIDSLYTSLSHRAPDLLYKGILRPVMFYLRRRRLQMLREYVINNKISIVHSHFAPFAYEMQSVVKGLDVRHIVSFYGYDYEQLTFRHPVFRNRYRELFKTAAGFIVEGTHGARTLEKMGCPKGKVHIVRLGVNTGDIPWFDRKKAKGRLKLVQVASITQKKGHYYTIRAFLNALKTAPNMTLTIVGSPKGAGENSILLDIEQQIDAAGVNDKVTLLPKLDFSKLYNFLSGYDAFIHPSCYADDMDSEGGAPVVLLDAQATGLPVISTTHCDIPDEVVHGETGLLSPEKDINALAESILRFYHMDADEYNAFTRKARQHVMENYDIVKSRIHLRTVYGKVLS